MPREKRSLALLAVSARACSGDMYRTVEMIVEE